MEGTQTATTRALGTGTGKMLLDESDHDWRPALLIGGRRDAPLDEVTAPWLVQLGHQFGGLACCWVDLCGLLVPLSGVPQARSLLPMFELLGGDAGSARRRHRRASLDGLHLTQGEAYDAARLERLQALLDSTDGLRFPRVIRGHEAWIELDSSSASLALLEGLPVLCRLLEPGVDLYDELAHEFVIGPPQLFAEATFTPRLLPALASSVAEVGVHLLWTNSD